MPAGGIQDPDQQAGHRDLGNREGEDAEKKSHGVEQDRQLQVVQIQGERVSAIAYDHVGGGNADIDQTQKLNSYEFCIS